MDDEDRRRRAAILGRGDGLDRETALALRRADHELGSRVSADETRLAYVDARLAAFETRLAALERLAGGATMGPTTTIRCPICGTTLEVEIRGPFEKNPEAVEVRLALSEHAMEHLRSHGRPDDDGGEKIPTAA